MWELQLGADGLQQRFQLPVQGQLVPIVGDYPVEGHSLVQAALRLGVVHPWGRAEPAPQVRIHPLGEAPRSLTPRPLLRSFIPTLRLLHSGHGSGDRGEPCCRALRCTGFGCGVMGSSARSPATKTQFLLFLVSSEATTRTVCTASP